MHNTLILFHGTTHDFSEIDVRRGKPYKDFGQGFYLTGVYERARNIAIRNRRIEEARILVMNDRKRQNVYVYEYEFATQDLDKLNVKKFASADREWLKFIIQNRMSRVQQHDYDIVIGPTANDDTRTSIRTVMNAANGRVLSDAAIDLLIEMLEPNNLPEQYFFGTNKAAALLKLTGRHEIK
jgi:hypothetical protein